MRREIGESASQRLAPQLVVGRRLIRENPLDRDGLGRRPAGLSHLRWLHLRHGINRVETNPAGVTTISTRRMADALGT